MEIEEADLIEDYFRQQLAGLTFNPDADRVFIPSGVACSWLGAALNEKVWHNSSKPQSQSEDR